MRLSIILLPLITIMLGKMYAERFNMFSTTVATSFKVTPVDTLKFDQVKAIRELRAAIKGKEQLASGRVFENIQSLDRVPAERLLRIMEMGFSESLGVTCIHCHTPYDWSSDEKPQKEIAREMMAMVGKINQDLLGAIKNLESENPMVNCTTCHRGQVKPALRIDW